MTQVCDDVTDMSKNVFVAIVVSIKGIFGIIAIFNLCWHVHKTKLKWLGHPNAKCIFVAHIGSTVFSTFFSSYMYLHDFVRLFVISTNNPCERELSAWWAFHSLSMYGCGDCCQLLTLFSLSLERLLASIRPGSYEKVKSYSLGLLLSIMSIVIGFGLFYYLLHYQVDLVGTVSVFSVVSSNNRQRYLVFKWMEFAFEISSLSLFLIIFFYNRSSLNKRFLSSLGSNYQRLENMKIVELLWPVFIIQFIIYTCNHFGFSLIATGDLSAADFYLRGEFISWTGLYGVAMPLILNKTIERRNKRQIESTNVQSKNVFVPIDQLFHQKPNR